MPRTKLRGDSHFFSREGWPGGGGRVTEKCRFSQPVKTLQFLLCSEGILACLKIAGIGPRTEQVFFQELVRASFEVPSMASRTLCMVDRIQKLIVGQGNLESPSQFPKSCD